MKFRWGNYYQNLLRFDECQRLRALFTELQKTIKS